MNEKLKFRLASTVLLAGVLACSLPARGQPTPASEIQTAAALTLQAIFTPSITSSPPQSTIAVTTSPSPTGIGTDAGTGTTTPTYSVPTLKVIEQTNCRTGPGQDYEVIFTYLKGKTLEIAGRYDPGNFWLVKSAESPTGTCWLWGEYVEVSGSYWAVSSVTPPATATLAPPRAPSIIEWAFSCSGGLLIFTVDWTDNASNETGYRIFRNGEPAAELPANSTTFTDSVAAEAGQSIDYYIQVYSPSGTGNSSVMRMSC